MNDAIDIFILVYSSFIGKFLEYALFREYLVLIIICLSCLFIVKYVKGVKK